MPSFPTIHAEDLVLCVKETEMRDRYKNIRDETAQKVEAKIMSRRWRLTSVLKAL